MSDNAHEDIAENWSARLDKSYLIQKIKQLENMYGKCAQLIRGVFNTKYAVYVTRAHTCQPPAGVQF